MAQPRMRARRRPSALVEALRGATQCLFALALILIFTMAILVGASAISLPQWAKNLDQYSDEERPARAGALLGCVCLLFILFFGAGLLQMRRENQTEGSRVRA
ncbi:hypothetical protein AB5N19_08187 [Seiridium cardinale]